LDPTTYIIFEHLVYRNSPQNNNIKREHKTKKTTDRSLHKYPLYSNFICPQNILFMTGRAQDLVKYIQISLDLGSPSFSNKAWMMSLGSGGRECLRIPLYWIERSDGTPAGSLDRSASSLTTHPRFFQHPIIFTPKLTTRSLY